MRFGGNTRDEFPINKENHQGQDERMITSVGQQWPNWPRVLARNPLLPPLRPPTPPAAWSADRCSGDRRNTTRPPLLRWRPLPASPSRSTGRDLSASRSFRMPPGSSSRRSAPRPLRPTCRSCTPGWCCARTSRRTKQSASRSLAWITEPFWECSKARLARCNSDSTRVARRNRRSR